MLASVDGASDAYLKLSKFAAERGVVRALAEGLLERGVGPRQVILDGVGLEGPIKHQLSVLSKNLSVVGTHPQITRVETEGFVELALLEPLSRHRHEAASISGNLVAVEQHNADATPDDERKQDEEKPNVDPLQGTDLPCCARAAIEADNGST